MLRNPKRFILASFLTFIITYILPATIATEYSTSYGFPIEYLTIPSNLSVGNSLLSSTSLNILGLTLNIAIFYALISLFSNYIDKLKL